jgi:hypothetical protein
MTVESDARASLISEIASAFAGVRLGGGVGLLEAQGLDDYADAEERKALRERDEKDDRTARPEIERGLAGYWSA